MTGTKDKNYNLIWYVEQCLNNVLKMEEYAGDAERDGDDELSEFFRKAQQASQRGADRGKELLKQKLDS
jgi:rubrerythrin